LAELSDLEPRVLHAWNGSDVAILRLFGEHDMASATEVAKRLHSLVRCGERIVVDLEETGFLDSSIVNVLLKTERELRARGSGLVLQLHGGSVARVLELTGVLNRFEHASTREEAVALARGGACFNE
jgi:anti-anti-sigma factor